MKYLVVSDIHGCRPALEKVLAFYKKEKYDMMLVLGDMLNYGPRNGVPEGLDAMGIAGLLNAMADSIVAVRGNCDSEVDQMVLPFPVVSDYAAVYADGLTMYLSHGHRQVPPLLKGDIYLTGHTHVPLIEDCGYLHLNPGSVSLPKENSERGYILYENKVFYFKTLDGKTYNKINA